MMETPEPGDRRPADTGTPVAAAPAAKPTRTPLEQAPGERYRRGDGEAASTSTAAVALRGAVVGLVGAAVLVLLGGPFSLSVGLLVIAGAIGWAIGRAVSSPTGPAASSATRRAIAALLAVASVLLAQVGLWLFARSQGGALGPIDYLVQARGVVVPLEVAIAVLLAWRTAR